MEPGAAARAAAEGGAGRRARWPRPGRAPLGTGARAGVGGRWCPLGPSPHRGPASSPYHVAPPHVEEVSVHHGAVAAALLGHAEQLRVRHPHGSARLGSARLGSARLGAPRPRPAAASPQPRLLHARTERGEGRDWRKAEAVRLRRPPRRAREAGPSPAHAGEGRAGPAAAEDACCARGPRWAPSAIRLRDFLPEWLDAFVDLERFPALLSDGTDLQSGFSFPIDVPHSGLIVVSSV
jgi:hypothetical protein